MTVTELINLVKGKHVTRVGRIFILQGVDSYQLFLGKDYATLSAINKRGDFIVNTYSPENNTYVDISLSIEDKTNLLKALKRT